MIHFTEEQKKRARKSDLYDYLARNHYDSFKLESNSLRPLNNHSISIKRGYCGYLDFATGEHGNSIDYLVKHMGYRIDEAVLALCGDDLPKGKSSSLNEATPHSSDITKGPEFPEPSKNSFRNLFAYLMKRGISQQTIQMLIDSHILYQDAKHNNIVFANSERDWGELRGTYDKSNCSFHGTVANSRYDGFWWFRTGSEPAKKVYICEAAIDAISLFELHRLDNTSEDAVYVSIGGVAKQPAINRLKHHINCVIAVDNDAAGKDCRIRNAELPCLIPKNKDWNEDLLERIS